MAPEQRDSATEILPAPASDATSPPTVIGRTLGKFVVVERLGRGGSGEVYRAEQAQLGRSAVIKVLRRDIAFSANRVDRFLREAKLASRLDHPYAAHVYAFGAESGGVLWIAMELVRGATIDELVARRGPMPPAVLGPLFARLCEVVHTAHELGIVHRDIKGSNVMVIERAGQLLPKLLDFGIAKGLDDAPSPKEDDDVGDDSSLTGHGSTLGSPQYMAPEQWTAPADVDARADIYALGVLAYRCVSGQLPYQAYDRVALANAHSTIPPPPLPVSVVPAIADVIMRALAKQPALRWPSALAFGEAMRRAVGGGAPEAVPSLDPATRDAWFRGGPQPIADAVARLARASTTVEADAALRELVGITCRWLAVLSLSQLDPEARYPDVRDAARSVINTDASGPWLRLARAAANVPLRRPDPDSAQGESEDTHGDIAIALGTRPSGPIEPATDDDPGDSAHGESEDTHGDVAIVLGTRPSGPIAEPATDDDTGGSAQDESDGDVAIALGTRPSGPIAEPATEVIATARAFPGLAVALAETAVLEALADRLDDRDRTRSMTALAFDVGALADALAPLEILLAYQLVVGRAGGAESWQGTRRRDRERVLVWGEPLAEHEVALLDATGRAVAKLSPLVQIVRPLPSAEAELFLLWRSGGRNGARLVAAPWGFERDDDAAAQRLASLTDDAGDPADDAGDDRSPYLGLVAYGLGDADRFVGREREVESLTNRLVRAPLLAVLGPSGVGKSSFIHAGLLPRLAEHHRIATMRPGRHPMHALSVVAGGEDDLVGKLRALGEQAARGLVLVIDQLEELVTLCSDPAERARFAETLAAAADGPGAPVRVVVTLRDDFATVIESEAALRGRFEVFVLATPPPEALRRIIVEPARRAGVTVDPRVVEDMIEEVAGRPASLPLLSFTASQLWQTRDRATKRITHDAYLALGGVAGALSAYADQVYGSLGRRDQEVVRDLFSRLVASDGTRVPAPRVELEELAGANTVLAHLIDARLLVVREDDGLDVVEVVHECLAERWPRLARWRSEDAADRALLGDVGAAARRWQEAKRRPDLLWRGEALAELRRLAGRSHAMTALERAFTDEAVRAERRSRQLRRIVLAMTMVALVGIAGVMAYLGIAATRSRTEAEQSAQAARDAARLAEERLTQSLLAQGRKELNEGRAQAALAYFAEAMRRGLDSKSLRFMIAVASRGWRFERANVRSEVDVIASSPTAVFAGLDRGLVRWWDGDGKVAGEIHTGLGFLSGIDAANEPVVAVGRDGIALLDTRQRKVAHRIKPKQQAAYARLGPGPDEIAAVEIEAIRIYGFDGTLRRTFPLRFVQGGNLPLIDSTGRYALTLEELTVHLIDLKSMTERKLATDAFGGPDLFDSPITGYVDTDRTIHILARDGAPLRKFRSPNHPGALVFSDAGDRIGAIAQNDMVVFDASGKQLHTVPLVGEHPIIALRGDHTWIATADGVVRHFVTDRLIASIPAHVTDIHELSVSGNLVAVLGSDSSVAILDGNAAHITRDKLPCENGPSGPEGIAYSYLCDRGRVLYIGRKKIAVARDPGFGWVAHDARFGRTALAGETLSVYDADAKLIASATEKTGHLGAVAFEDADRLLVLEPRNGTGLWRWTISANRWERVAPGLQQATSIASVAGGLLVGFIDGHLALVRDGKELKRIPLGNRPEQLSVSGDRQWAAAQLSNGGVAIIDGKTGDLVRTLAPADTTGAAPMLDTHAEFVLRSSRGKLSVWDRIGGEELVYNLDLLNDAWTAAFDHRGRIEATGRWIGLVDIVGDTRPVAEILAEIACRIPLRVVDGRLAPAERTKTDCQPR